MKKLIIFLIWRVQLVHPNIKKINFTLETNFIGTHNLLKIAKNNATFIQASTSEVYGDPEVHRNLYQNVNTIGKEHAMMKEKSCRHYATSIRKLQFKY